MQKRYGIITITIITERNNNTLKNNKTDSSYGGGGLQVKIVCKNSCLLTWRDGRMDERLSSIVCHEVVCMFVRVATTEEKARNEASGNNKTEKKKTTTKKSYK